eukprot:TRINITY_DN2343_c0_g1_i1.p1 TRINITY_DN2343_c0_g1~~TRINITY_DN2343_c0_g1_i1.p1  ORF type:complete len:133 (-),score=31.71 TRINITY_DN2343_c0_g1_i1:56-454(-)
MFLSDSPKQGAELDAGKTNEGSFFDFHVADLLKQPPFKRPRYFSNTSKKHSLFETNKQPAERTTSHKAAKVSYTNQTQSNTNNITQNNITINSTINQTPHLFFIPTAQPSQQSETVTITKLQQQKLILNCAL